VDDKGVPSVASFVRFAAPYEDEDAAGNVSPPSPEIAATARADTTPPTKPAGLTATAGARSASLSWTAASDNVGVTGYRVFRDGAQVATTPSPSYTDSGLATATTYSYTVGGL
jgi:hypothetical protein